MAATKTLAVHSIGTVAQIAQRSPGTIEATARKLGIAPATTINNLPHYADADVDRIVRHLASDHAAKIGRATPPVACGSNPKARALMASINVAAVSAAKSAKPSAAAEASWLAHKAKLDAAKRPAASAPTQPRPSPQKAPMSTNAKPTPPQTNDPAEKKAWAEATAAAEWAADAKVRKSFSTKANFVAVRSRELLGTFKRSHGG